MSKKQTKQHRFDKACWATVWLISLLAVIYVAWQIREPQVEPKQQKAQQSSQAENARPKPGFEQFSFSDQNVAIYLPEEQAPFLAAGSSETAILLASKDYTLGLHDKTAFTFDVWGDQSLLCAYDRPLGQFANNCNLTSDQYKNLTTIFSGEFSRQESTRLTVLISLDLPQKFLSITGEQPQNCNRDNLACDAQFRHKKQKLTTFAHDIIDANEQLFSTKQD